MKMFRRNLVRFIILLLVSCSSEKTEISNEKEENIIPSVTTDYIAKITGEIEQSPGNAELYFKRAQAHWELKNTHYAFQDMRKATSLAPSKFEYLSRYADMYIASDSIERAMEVLEKCYKLKPEDRETNINLGIVYIYLGDSKKSISYLNNALKQDIHNPEIYFLKGYNFKQLKDTNSAVSNFQTALELDPEYYEPNVELGLIMSKRKDELAEQYFKNAIRIDSAGIDAYYGLAMYYQDSGAYKQAIETYKKIVLLDTRFEKAYYNLGYIYLAQDSVVKAQRHFDIAIKVAPFYVKAYYKRGECFEKQGKFAEALKDYRKTLSLDENFTAAREGIKRLEEKI